MLKFIRKYQLPILVVGGSLLMVVFLLQPVLTRLSPSPAKAKVASLASGDKITSGDRQLADFEINVIGRINPRAVLPAAQGGMGLTQVESDRPLHWILLSKAADDAGLIGDAADGYAWIQEIAQTEARVVVEQRLSQGLYTTKEEYIQELNELTDIVNAQLNRNAVSAAGAVPNYTQDDVYRTLAKARGIYRLKYLYNTTPAYSDLGAIAAAHESSDAVAVNATVINASLLTDTIADPTEEQLQAFFDEYKDQFPAESEFAVGYQKPTRVRLAYLMLNRDEIYNTVPSNRVEIVKIHQQNRDIYPGDLPSERAEIERKYKGDITNEMMIEADRIIRAQVINATRGLPSSDGVIELPEDWNERRPQLEQIANAVVSGLKERFDTDIPTPTVRVFGNQWFDASALSMLPDFGSAQYRVGTRQFPAAAIPSVLDLEDNNTGLIIQPGLPLVSPPATDANENRYYAVVLDIRPAGPADSIDDAGRDNVIRDYKNIKGYEQLAASADQLRAAIATTGTVNAGIDAALALADSQAPAPQIQENILVRKDSIDRGRRTPFVNPALNTEIFRSTVLESAASIPPLTAPDAIDSASRAIAVPLPTSKALALASIVAPRPMTSERFRNEAPQVMSRKSFSDLSALAADAVDPFSFDALSSRFGLELVKSKKDKDNAKPQAADAELAPSS